MTPGPFLHADPERKKHTDSSRGFLWFEKENELSTRLARPASLAERYLVFAHSLFPERCVIAAESNPLCM